MPRPLRRRRAATQFMFQGDKTIIAKYKGLAMQSLYNLRNFGATGQKWFKFADATIRVLKTASGIEKVWIIAGAVAPLVWKMQEVVLSRALKRPFIYKKNTKLFSLEEGDAVETLEDNIPLVGQTQSLVYKSATTETIPSVDASNALRKEVLEALLEDGKITTFVEILSSFEPNKLLVELPEEILDLLGPVGGGTDTQTQLVDGLFPDLSDAAGSNFEDSVKKKAVVMVEKITLPLTEEEIEAGETIGKTDWKIGVIPPKYNTVNSPPEVTFLGESGVFSGNLVRYFYFVFSLNNILDALALPEGERIVQTGEYDFFNLMEILDESIFNFNDIWYGRTFTRKDFINGEEIPDPNLVFSYIDSDSFDESKILARRISLPGKTANLALAIVLRRHRGVIDNGSGNPSDNTIKSERASSHPQTGTFYPHITEAIFQHSGVPGAGSINQVSSPATLLARGVRTAQYQFNGPGDIPGNFIGVSDSGLPSLGPSELFYGAPSSTAGLEHLGVLSIRDFQSFAPLTYGQLQDGLAGAFAVPEAYRHGRQGSDFLNNLGPLDQMHRSNMTYNDTPGTAYEHLQAVVVEIFTDLVGDPDIFPNSAFPGDIYVFSDLVDPTLIIFKERFGSEIRVYYDDVLQVALSDYLTTEGMSFPDSTTVFGDIYDPVRVTDRVIAWNNKSGAGPTATCTGSAVCAIYCIGGIAADFGIQTSNRVFISNFESIATANDTPSLSTAYGIGTNKASLYHRTADDITTFLYNNFMTEKIINERGLDDGSRTFFFDEDDI